MLLYFVLQIERKPHTIVCGLCGVPRMPSWLSWLLAVRSRNFRDDIGCECFQCLKSLQAACALSLQHSARDFVPAVGLAGLNRCGVIRLLEVAVCILHIFPFKYGVDETMVQHHHVTPSNDFIISHGGNECVVAGSSVASEHGVVHVGFVQRTCVAAREFGTCQLHHAGVSVGKAHHSACESVAMSHTVPLSKGTVNYS